MTEWYRNWLRHNFGKLWFWNLNRMLKAPYRAMKGWWFR